MKNFDLNACGVQEMNAAEVAEVNGGFLPFVAGAICGGMLYDAWKAGVKYVLSGEYQGGPMPPR